MAAITYTADEAVGGPQFTCPRCKRIYAYPKAGEKPIRCECGWWYTFLRHDYIREEFHPRIGGDDRPIK